MPIVPWDKVNAHAECVALYDSLDAAQEKAIILDGICDNKRIMLITPGSLETCTHESVKSDCKLHNAQGRLTAKTFYHTNLGGVNMKPDCIKENGVKAPQITLVNSLRKIVTHLWKDLCSKKDWGSGTLVRPSEIYTNNGMSRSM